VLRFYSAGESHGRGIFCFIDNLPAGLRLEPEDINFWLAERQKGYGRGGRQRIERDEVDVLSGMRGGVTLGSPLLLAVWNRDFENWRSAMDPWQPPTGERAERVVQPRPSHADLVGAMKYGFDDCRNVLERASARETAARVAAGAVARKLLGELGIQVAAHVVQIGDVTLDDPDAIPSDQIHERSMASEVRCCDPAASERMIEAIRAAKQDKDTVGGIVEIRAWGMPPGVGSYVQWDQKLDARIAQHMMSIQAIKGVEIGVGFRGVGWRGSAFHDEILRADEPRAGSRYRRATNKLGGTEGGMSNGEEVVVRIAKKPISTLMKPLRTVNIDTREPTEAIRERSDTCAVPALAIIAESVLAWVVADAMAGKFGHDTVEEMQRNLAAYCDAIARR
jgi:chorismate synthase